MRSHVQRCLVAAILAIPILAGAIPIQSSTGTFLTIRDCTGAGSSCSALSPIVNSLYAGEPGDLSVTASLSFSPIRSGHVEYSALGRNRRADSALARGLRCRQARQYEHIRAPALHV